jgi:hypothetical protein
VLFQSTKPNGRLGLAGRGVSTVDRWADDARMTLVWKRLRWRLSPAARRARIARAQRVAELSLAKRGT